MKSAVAYCFIIAVVAGAVLLSGCTQQQAATPTGSPSEIKVGAMVSLTGPASNVGNNMWQSAQIAAD